jgi:hypothetical protein
VRGGPLLWHLRCLGSCTKWAAVRKWLSHRCTNQGLKVTPFPVYSAGHCPAGWCLAPPCSNPLPKRESTRLTHLAHFRLTLKPTLVGSAAATQIPLVTVHDEVTLVGQVELLYRELCQGATSFGLTEVPCRFAVYGPSHKAAARFAAAPGVPQTHKGFVVAGSLVGSSTRRSSKVTDSIAPMPSASGCLHGPPPPIGVKVQVPRPLPLTDGPPDLPSVCGPTQSGRRLHG